MADTAARPFVPPPGWLGQAGRDRGPLSAGFLAAATALGALLRLGGLLHQSLWVDEILTWNAVRPDAGLHFLEQVRDAIQGPLYVAVVWPLVRLADPELMLRLPAAVAGVLTVPLFGAVAGRLLERRAARLAVLLVAVNPFLIWYSQEARGYAFVVLFATAMAWAFLRQWEHGPNRRDGLLFALASTAAVASNMSGLFLWGALALTAVPRLVRRPRERLGWLLTFAGGLAASAPWLLQAGGIWAVDRIVPGAATGAALRGTSTFDPLALPYSVFSIFYGFSLGPSLRDLHGAAPLAAVKTAWPWLLAGAVPVAAGVLAGVAGTARRRVPPALLPWILVPFLAVLALALRNVKPWNVRYVAVAAPWLVALVAAGLATLPRRPGTLLAGLLCALTLVSLGNVWLTGRYERADLRGAAAWLADHDGGDDPVLVPDVTGVWTFYAGTQRPVIATWGEPPLADAAAADAFVAARLQGKEAAWVVLARTWRFDPRGLLLPALARAGTVTERAVLPGVRILSWRAAPPAEGGGHGG